MFVILAMARIPVAGTGGGGGGGVFSFASILSHDSYDFSQEFF